MRLGEVVLVVPDVEDALGGGRQPARRTASPLSKIESGRAKRV